MPRRPMCSGGSPPERIASEGSRREGSDLWESNCEPPSDPVTDLLASPLAAGLVKIGVVLAVIMTVVGNLVLVER